MGVIALFLLLLFGLVVAVLLVGGWIVVTVLSLAVSLLMAIGGEALPILLIVAGAWLVWRALADNRRHRNRMRQRAAYDHAGAAFQQGHGPQSAASTGASRRGQRRRRGESVAAADPVQQAAAPQQRRELPIDVQVKAEQIQRKADLLLTYADRFPPFSQSLHIVRQTAADYLPRTIKAYLALPGLSDPIVPSTGRTALTELRAQLQLLDAKLDDITLDLQQQDLDQMSANRRFLEERFGGTGASQGTEDGEQPPRPQAHLLDQSAPTLRAVS